MVRVSRISAVFCFGVAAVASAACFGEDVTQPPLGSDATVTQVIPFDTATSGSGDAGADTVTASDRDHLCPPGDAGDPGASDAQLPPLPTCSTDPVIQSVAPSLRRVPLHQLLPLAPK